MNPPSLCIVALTVWLVGLAMLVRDPLNRWLTRPRPWALVVTAGSSLMTLFLWHLTALLLAVLVLHPLGVTRPIPGTATWWALRPLWLLVPAVLLVPLVALFSRLERPRAVRRLPARVGPGVAPPAPTGLAPILLAVAGTAAVIVGILGVAVGGIWPLPGSPANLAGLHITPGASLLFLPAGMLLLTLAGASRPRPGGRLAG
jgi:hypothetical protein